MCLNSHCCRGYCILESDLANGIAKVSIPTAAGVTASLFFRANSVRTGLNSHCCRGYCIAILPSEQREDGSQFPLLQGLLHLMVANFVLWFIQKSQFPLLQGLLHLHPSLHDDLDRQSLNSHCCRGYCI